MFSLWLGYFNVSYYKKYFTKCLKSLQETCNWHTRQNDSGEDMLQTAFWVFGIVRSIVHQKKFGENNRRKKWLGEHICGTISPRDSCIENDTFPTLLCCLYIYEINENGILTSAVNIIVIVERNFYAEN